LYHNKNVVMKDYLSNIEICIIKELKKVIEDSSILNDVNEMLKIISNDYYKLPRFLDFLFPLTLEKFVFVIDEWDYMFEHDLYTIEE